MDVIGLVSGGKDSIYNLVECVRLGHRIVCIANLYPAALPSGANAVTTASSVTYSSKPSAQEDAAGAVSHELDSFMFQTVGHTAIECMAEALQLPLVRRTTHGKAVHSGLEYAPSEGKGSAASPARSAETLVAVEVDEVEDMYELLRDALRRFPTAKAVACGAILSNYQRIRVEHVCARLGLTAFAFLWQRSQPELLQDMISNGIDAVLIKVASYGLTARMLGKSIAALQRTFIKAEAECGLNVCGEGGEYETLVLDCPLYPTHRLALTEVKQVNSGGSSIAPVAHLEIVSCELVPKTNSFDAGGSLPEASDGIAVAYGNPCASHPPLVIPGLLSDAGSRADCAPLTAATLLQPTILARDDGGGSADLSLAAPSAARRCDASARLRSTGSVCFTNYIRDAHFCTCLEAAFPGILAAAQEGIASPARTAAQLVVALEGLRASLSVQGASLRDCLFIHLYIDDMAAFGAVNAAYCRYFGDKPPSRSCVQLQFTAKCAHSESTSTVSHSSKVEDVVAVQLDALYLPCSWVEMASQPACAARSVLHVSSLSRWAPLCIGPYCQANSTANGLLLLAGQIGLQPECMALVPGGLVPELVQACNNVERVLESLQSTPACIVSAVVFVSSSELCRKDASDGDTAGVHACIRKYVEQWMAPPIAVRPRTRSSSSSSSSECDAGDARSKHLVADSQYRVHSCALSTSDDAASAALPQRHSIHIVCVPRLPRNATVEIEVVACRASGNAVQRTLPHIVARAAHADTRTVTPTEKSIDKLPTASPTAAITTAAVEASLVAERTLEDLSSSPTPAFQVSVATSHSPGVVTSVWVTMGAAQADWIAECARSLLPNSIQRAIAGTLSPPHSSSTTKQDSGVPVLARVLSTAPTSCTAFVEHTLLSTVPGMDSLLDAVCESWVPSVASSQCSAIVVPATCGDIPGVDSLSCSAAANELDTSTLDAMNPLKPVIVPVDGIIDADIPVPATGGYRVSSIHKVTLHLQWFAPLTAAESE